jgi:putative transposase
VSPRCKVSTVGACRLAQLNQTGWYRRPTADDQPMLCARTRELPHARARFSSLRIWVLLRREGWAGNRERVRRLFRLDGLQLLVGVRRRNPWLLYPGPAPVPVAFQERWSMDVVHDHSADEAIGDGPPPRSFKRYHGTEFTSCALAGWAYLHGVAPDFTRTGQPTDNGSIEWFNGR